MMRHASLFLVVIWLSTLAAPIAEARRPNVLLIMTDDQGYGDLSIHGNPLIRTPHIDGLGDRSVRFDRFYVNSFCAPTRAALLTGRWPLRTGVFGVTHNKEAMRADEVSLAEAFRSAGYQTACIGKWHNGEQYPLTPTGQGFDEFFGFTAGHWNNYFNATLLRGADPEPTRGYITDVLTNDAIRFMTSVRSAPFFCYVAWNAPHSPYQVPDHYFDRPRAQDLPSNVAAFCGMCENIDDNVGRLLQFLDDLSLLENTVVLFLTDNGGTAGVKYFNAGMRGGKTSVHEGGTRVPLFMSWPAADWQPEVRQQLTSHIDIFPTLLDLCSIDPPPGPPVDGRSLRPLLEGEDQVWPDRVLFTHNPIDEHNRFPGAVRTSRYRLVREISGPAGGSAATNKDENASPWQLYDMQNDPGEVTDLADQHPEVVSELSRLYEEWFDDISGSGLRRLPLPVGFAQHNPVELHAPQAFFDDPLRFANGPGFANDWLTNWTDESASVWFEIDVSTEGTYAISLSLACAEADAGSQIRIRCGEEFLMVTVPAAPAKEIALPHRDDRSRTRYRNRNWASVPAGSLRLTRGRHQLRLEPVQLKGSSLIDLKAVTLERINPRVDKVP